MTDRAGDSAIGGIAISDSVRDGLLRLLEGWIPEPMNVAGVQQMRYGLMDAADLEPVLEVRTDRLLAKLNGPRLEIRAAELRRNASAEQSSQPLFSLGDDFAGVIVEGVPFRGEVVTRLSLGAQLVIEASQWLVGASSPPALWISRIENPIEINYGGNLVIDRHVVGQPFFGHPRHFRFEGVYVYYLVQTGGRKAPAWYLVIDTEGAALNQDVLEREFLILQFVLGRQLRVVELLGVSPNLETIASRSGAGSRLNLVSDWTPPVPINRNNDAYVDEAWTALLFERLATACRDRTEIFRPLVMALDAYLDAMSPHLDANYLRLHVGLEGFASTIARTAGTPPKALVKDKSAWDDWVRTNSDAIRSFANTGFEDLLFGKVMRSGDPASSQAVPDALKLHGLAVTKELQEELRKRNVVVHQGVMTTGDYDADRDLRRIAIVRTLLVALIAKVVGYGGAINGWEIGKHGYPVEPAQWWHVKDSAREAASRTHDCVVD